MRKGLTAAIELSLAEGMSLPLVGFIAATEALGHDGARIGSNLDRYRKDLDSLITKGDQLFLGIQKECLPEEFDKAMKQHYKDKAHEFIEKVPSFTDSYQTWYSEAKVLVKQLLPDRLSDFAGHYEKPKSRKSLTYETYRIEDYLQGLNVTSGDWEKKKIVGPDAAIPQFRQQLAILKSIERRFESSLFDIRQLVQADLFDSDLDAAEELAKNKFTRAAQGPWPAWFSSAISRKCAKTTASKSQRSRPSFLISTMH